MNQSYYIEIKGLEHPVEFVEKWSKCYKYSGEGKYDNYIRTVLDDDNSFLQLFKWKNGKGEGISGKKMKVINGWIIKMGILKNLKNKFDWGVFESEFEPTESSPIWKIFLLHLINPNEFPIFDQHVYRFFNFFRNGIIEEIPDRPQDVYLIYKNDYHPWFNSFRKEYNLNPKQMDMSFFTYGQLLKRLNGLPIERKIK